MIIIGVDYHPSDQYIALVDTETGEYGERQLNHGDREAEKFYRELAARGVSVRVGIEATGYSRWFERLLTELGFEIWIIHPPRPSACDPAQRRTSGFLRSHLVQKLGLVKFSTSDALSM